MNNDLIEYGLRCTRTGHLVRAEERHYQSEEMGAETDVWLSFDQSFPYLKSGELGSLFMLRYGSQVFGRQSSAYLLQPATSDGIRDVADLELVEFVTTNVSTPVPGGDPVGFSTEVRALSFDIHENVVFQYPGRVGQDPRKQLVSVFGREDYLAMAAVPGIKLSVLKSAAAGSVEALQPGAILVPPRREGRLSRGPVGLVAVKWVDGITYAAVTEDVMHPFFRQSRNLLPASTEEQEPWDDMKIAFGFDGDTTNGSLIMEIWDDQLDGRSIWPQGWSLVETDTQGARAVAVFRVEGRPAREDGHRVKAVLEEISAGNDPRYSEGPMRPR